MASWTPTSSNVDAATEAVRRVLAACDVAWRSWVVGWVVQGSFKKKSCFGGESKQYKIYGQFQGFPFLLWIAWVGNIMTCVGLEGPLGSDSHWLCRPTRLGNDLSVDFVLVFFFGDAWNQLRMCVVKQKDGCWKREQKRYLQGRLSSGVQIIGNLQSFCV